MELKKAKSTLYLEGRGFRLRREFHRDQFCDEIHTEKVNTRPCRFGSQGKVNTTWSGKVEVYTAVAFVAPTSKICTGAGTVCAPPSACDLGLGNEVLAGGKLSCRLRLRDRL